MCKIFEFFFFQGLKRSSVETLIEPEIAYILCEVTSALTYLHGHHRIHRDIKGTNILLTKEGNFVVNYSFLND